MTEPALAAGSGGGNGRDGERSPELAGGGKVWEVAGVPALPEPTSAAERPPTEPTPPPLVRVIEAILFLGGPALTFDRAAAAVRGLTAAPFTQVLDTLNRDYRRQRRPYAVRVQDGGYVLALRPRFEPVLEKIYGGGREARLSPAAVDVLALVAYRQPATRQEIEGLRGAECAALLRQLVRRGLVAVIRRGDAGGKDVCYVTTSRFFKVFGLKSLDDLPQTQDLQLL